MARLSTMHRLQALLAICAGGVIAMASCSGGGGSATPSAANPPVSQTLAKVTPPSASSRTVYGTATLSLKLPTVFTARNAKAVRATHSGSSRTPAYVNPTTSNLIDIFINGTLAPNLDGTAGPNDSLVVQSTSTGVQSITIPLYSTQINYIVAVERDSTGSKILAVGETDQTSFTPGVSNPISLTMLMNAQTVGILDVYQQADAETLTGQTYYGLSSSCGNTGAQSQFGLYDADDLGTFVADAGYGGTTQPTYTYSSNAPGTTAIQQSTIAGIGQVAWDGPCDGVTLTATAVNPVSPIITDLANENTPNFSYDYYYCYYYQSDGYTCPGGPYQGLWDMTYVYAEPYSVSSHLNTSTISGSIVITASPNPGPSG